MYILYLDESGVTQPNPDNSHYVVLGLAIHESTWYALEARVAAVRKRFGLEPGAEIHAAWILRRYREQEVVEGFEDLDWPARRAAVLEVRRLKRQEWNNWTSKRRTRKAAEYRKTEAFIHLTRQERTDLVDAALEVVSSHSNKLYLLGEAINKETLGDAVDPIDESFDQIVTRFERSLQRRISRQRTWGLLVADHNETQAKRLPKMLKRFQRTGTRWSRVERVIEAPFFVDSATCSGVQLADSCAYVLRRYLEKGEPEQARMTGIFAKFYRAKGKLIGLRHFTQRGCTCMICRERGHDRTD